ncbi:mannose-P-dolichol utilization defect 1 protein-like protein [Dinothrombium tinctorium]|uniref:Mannose-P-dolichol utilization defect 1 protein homolog n=1 Tax=Dinothrombium tinctorium TaxID=1965070 RepID=A0A3S4RCS3_9ACAR|nr:mannose-P-dolichol utilization defect 1 protein-like protein [Dinothrombium tinctorium]
MATFRVKIPLGDEIELSEEMVKTLIAKTLGYSIIVSSAFVKLPQLIKVCASKSSSGLSFLGAFMELLAVTFNTSYSLAKRYPFSSWGEAPFLQFETASIAFFILWYSRQQKQALTFLFTYSLLVFLLVSGLVPITVLWYLQATNLPLAVAGKMIQARKNYINHHTGQLSIITSFLLFAGCVTRIFTTLHETGDKLIALTFIAAAAANFVLVAQIFYYWKNTNEFLLKEQKKKTS